MAIRNAVESLVTPEKLPITGAVVAAVAAGLAIPVALKYLFDPFSTVPSHQLVSGSMDAQREFFSTEAAKVYLEGYRKFTAQAFRTTTFRTAPVICVPPKFLNELQKYPDDVLSITAAIDEIMQGDYTNFPKKNESLVHMVKADLTPALVRLNPAIHQETISSVRTHFGDCAEWTELNATLALLKVVAEVSGRIFVGPEYCRNETYVDCSINYSVDLMQAARAVPNVPSWKRWWSGHRIPEVKTLQQREELAMKEFVPLVEARLEAQKDPNAIKPDDAMQWTIDRMVADGRVDPRAIAKGQLIITFAAIHTTSTTVTNILYTLASMPEVAPMLRAEISESLAASNGVFDSAALQRLKKLDSFIREDMRVNPLGYAHFSRTVLKPITLSNGQKIPAGVTIEVASTGINKDESIWENPETFDPLRFYKLRSGGAQNVSQSARSQIVSVNTEHLNFGFGRHACPGRFFAANEIKMILAELLLNYDIELVGTKERYPNFVVSGQNIPDPTKNLRFKRAVI